MRRTAVTVLSALALLLAVVAAPVAHARPEPLGNGNGLGVYVGEISADQLEELRGLGLSRESIAIKPGRNGRISVEVILGVEQVRSLRSQGIDLKAKRVGGESAVQLMAKQARQGFEVFRPWSGPGGLREEIVQTANEHPEIAKLVKFGESLQGQDMLAVKVTKDAREVRDGARPAVLYSANQHAREWITPEMVRRLLHYFLDRYGTDREITRIIDTTELWFAVSLNPDGYDWTFQPGQRLWRKNLRDNDGDGELAIGQDGIDLNRNLSYRWGYDNEGSSANPGSQTYRGTGPLSEPESQAIDGLLRRVGFEYMINYHSAAELLLYGVGWQVSTPTPDDVVYEALVGDDEDPAVPGYDPDISAELYTTNGELTEHAHNVYGTLAITPEMSTCQTAAASDPDDEWEPEECPSVFVFPDDEQLVQAEFEKNIALAVAAAKSARDPDHPVSPVGRTAADFQVDEFGMSYGSPQPVAVVARRDLRAKHMRYRVNGGRKHTAQVQEWNGGERYGDEGDVHYAEYRGTVRGTSPGDKVEVWFTAAKPRAGRVESEHFTYTVADVPHDARVLVLANEDYSGVNPDYPENVTEPKYVDEYVGALAHNGIDAAVWDVTDQGVPHHLGVLGHFDVVVWYLGDNRLTQDPEDEITDVLGTGFRDAAVAERQQYLTMSVRDYLNEGGKVLHTGETAQYFGVFGGIGGIWYGLDGHPEQDCVITEAADDCVFLADDFSQYYLGAFDRFALDGPSGVVGTGSPFDGAAADFGGPAAEDNPLNEAGDYQVTSDVLPVDQFPQFRSWEAGEYQGVAGPLEPVEGQWYVAGRHENQSYMRLARTIDLTQVAAADGPRLEFMLNFDLEAGYDNVIIEAHPVGTDDWTTLPDANGGTDSGVPTECSAGFLLAMHPFLEHYLTPGNPCQATGTTGEWHRFTGSSSWSEVAVDLSAYAGQEVEVAVSYVTDPFTGGVGVFVDDTRVVVGGETIEADGFESGLGAWSTPGPPAGSPTGGGDFQRSQALIDSAAAVATEDTVLLGFGLEQVATAAERADLMGRAMGHLLGTAG